MCFISLLRVQICLLKAVVYVCTRSTGGQRITIDPSGTFRTKQGTQVSIRSEVPISTRNHRIVYNGKESVLIPSLTVGNRVNISIPPFEATATFFDANATYLFFQFDVVLLSKFDDASIRISASSGLANVYSPFLNLTVLCKSLCLAHVYTLERFSRFSMLQRF